MDLFPSISLGKETFLCSFDILLHSNYWWTFDGSMRIWRTWFKWKSSLDFIYIFPLVLTLSPWYYLYFKKLKRLSFSCVLVVGIFYGLIVANFLILNSSLSYSLGNFSLLSSHFLFSKKLWKSFCSCGLFLVNYFFGLNVWFGL